MHPEHTIINNEKLMHFEIHGDNEVAFLEYRFYHNKIVFMHTSVPETMEGKGVGSALAAKAFVYAKDNNMPVIVYCPFVLTYLKRHPELRGQLDAASV